MKANLAKKKNKIIFSPQNGQITMGEGKTESWTFVHSSFGVMDSSEVAKWWSEIGEGLGYKKLPATRKSLSMLDN